MKHDKDKDSLFSSFLKYLSKGSRYLAYEKWFDAFIKDEKGSQNYPIYY